MPVILPTYICQPARGVCDMEPFDRADLIKSLSPKILYKKKFIFFNLLCCDL